MCITSKLLREFAFFTVLYIIHLFLGYSSVTQKGTLVF